MCDLTKGDGLGFRCLAMFNVALLAKQGWRILTNATTLVTRVLQSKYNAHSQFMEAELKSQPSVLWLSIWVAKGLLQKGCA